jgi:hypothetical protein
MGLNGNAEFAGGGVARDDRKRMYRARWCDKLFLRRSVLLGLQSRGDCHAQK